MKKSLKSIYYQARDALSQPETLSIEDVSIQLPSYYFSEMDWTLETERPVLTKFLEIVDRNDTVWDIGAHVGVYALLGAAKGAESIAIEAYKPTAERGQRYASLNDLDVDYRILALGDGSTNSIRRGGLSDPIPTVTGDNLVEQGINPPTVIKMDIEGAEYAALTGLEDTLERHVKVIIIELHLDLLEERGVSQTDIESLLEGHGFAVETLADRELENYQPFLIATKNRK